MEINYINEYTFTFEYEEEMNQLAQIVYQKVGKSKEYVASCIFVDDIKIKEINQSYRNLDATTDVISFALQDETTVLLPEDCEIELGDIFINIDACERQAIEYNHSFKRELCFLFVHGLLHLFGFDHMCEEDEKVMFNLQKEILDGSIPR